MTYSFATTTLKQIYKIHRVLLHRTNKMHSIFVQLHRRLGWTTWSNTTEKLPIGDPPRWHQVWRKNNQHCVTEKGQHSAMRSRGKGLRPSRVLCWGTPCNFLNPRSSHNKTPRRFGAINWAHHHDSQAERRSPPNPTTSIIIHHGKPPSRKTRSRHRSRALGAARGATSNHMPYRQDTKP
jgi:hypothetical protein